jgi:tRNA-dihydrouridine synthase A
MEKTAEKNTVEEQKSDNQTVEETKEKIEPIPMKLARPFKRSLINPVKERIAIAPMVDVTDNYFRWFMRLLTKHSFLYTEMLNEHAILYN